MTPWLQDADVTLYHGDVLAVLRELPAESVDCCVTSPPYWGLRDYGDEGQLGLEPTPEEYVTRMVEVFREVRRVLAKHGTVWLNLGDSYINNPQSAVNRNGLTGSLNEGKADFPVREATRGSQQRQTIPEGLKPKDLAGIPWRVAFALQADGWYLRSDIIWAKPNPMPESVTDRPTKAHEYVFLLSKNPRYFFDQEAVREAAEWQRWGDQTNGKHEGSGSAAGWITSRPKSELQRPQARRAMELFEQAGLTEEHARAIRAVGITDTGKATVTQDGTGKSDPALIALADEAKNALGGYYREFLVPNGRNIRSVWEIATQPYPEAHFATFPEELARRCIAAGTSERGRCPECGAPWLREFDTSGHRTGYAEDRRPAKGSPHPAYREHGETLQTVTRSPVGWKPLCGCRHGREYEDAGALKNTWRPFDPTPCVVLDPFIGSGTVAHVARKLGRHAIGIDLNAEYLELAARRLQQQSLFAEMA